MRVRVEEADRDLVVDLAGAVVEVGGADRPPYIVDGHDLLMQQGLRVFEDAHAAGQQLREIAMRRVLHQRDVGGSCNIEMPCSKRSSRPLIGNQRGLKLPKQFFIGLGRNRKKNSLTFPG